MRDIGARVVIVGMLLLLVAWPFYFLSPAEPTTLSGKAMKSLGGLSLMVVVWIAGEMVLGALFEGVRHLWTRAVRRR